jgi:hypothetical protein
MLQVLQQQMQRDKWEKDQMLKKINELTYMVEALNRNYKGSTNSDPMSPGNSVIGTMDRRRVSEYVGDQLNQLDAMSNRESEDERKLQLYRERERRDLELEHLKREYEARIRQLREQQFRGQPSREQQNRENETMGPTTNQPQSQGLLLESQYPHHEENSGPFHINDDPAHYDVYYDSEPEDKVNYEDAVSNHSRTSSFQRPHLSNSNNNSDKSSVYSGGQFNSNPSNPVYTNDQASVYSNGYSNTNYDRAGTFSEGIPSNDRSRMVDYGIQSNYVERGSNYSNGHPSPYSNSSDRNSSNSSTVGPTTVYGGNPISMHNSPPPMYGNSTHLGAYSTSPTNGYINNYSGMNSGYTSSSHRSNQEDENQLIFERRQSELNEQYTELMEMAQK